MPTEYTSIATVPLSDDATALIQVYPWRRIEEGGYHPQSPELVLDTRAGELRFRYAAERRAFTVRAVGLRFGGMPAGLALSTYADEDRGAAYRTGVGDDASAAEDPRRTPKFRGYDVRRSDDRAVTGAMRSRCWDLVDANTALAAGAGHLARLVEVSEQWHRRLRLVEVEARLAELEVERATLTAGVDHCAW